jgi:hypothetical protein
MFQPKEFCYVPKLILQELEMLWSFFKLIESKALNISWLLRCSFVVVGC